MSTRHSTRTQPSGRARNLQSHPAPAEPPSKEAAATREKQSRANAKAAPKKQRAARRHNLEETLGRFADALALVETGYAALDSAQQDWDGDGARIGCPAVRTIEHGLKALAQVYNEVDRAIMALS